MVRQSVIVVIVYLLTFLQYSKAAKQDYIISIFNQKKSEEGVIKIDGKSTKGNGMSVCSWIKQEAEDLSYFLAIDFPMNENHLRADVILSDAALYAESGKYENGEYLKDYVYEYIEDCNLKNLTSWFHVCIIKTKTSFLFYLNGFPSEYYTEYANISAKQSDNLSLLIGDTYNDGGNSSLYQLNAFDRVITANDAKNMHNCKFMNGDLVSWNDITSKSKDFKFGKNTQLIQAPVPCPTPPPYNGINCNTGEPLQDSSNTAGGEPSSPSSDSGSSSPSENSGQSSPSGDSGQSLASGDSGQSSPSDDSGSSSPSKDSGSSSPSGDSGQSSTSGDSGSSSPSKDSGSSSPSKDSGSSSPSKDSGQSSTSGDSGSSSPNAGTAPSSGN